MEIDWRREAEALQPELTALRREFHRHPELGNQEFETASRIEACLEAWGISCRRLLGTAVVGELRGSRPGGTAALRADMDALPVREDTGAPFISQVPGVMHACGHDFHMAAVLGAAKLLAAHREELPGTVKLFFQPDEEGSGGAERMVAAGCMAAPPVGAVFGAHVSPDLQAGTVGVRFGKFYAASDTFELTLLGQSAHGAEPEKGKDALAAAAELVCALRALPGRFLEERSVLSVGTLRAGSAINVIADRASLTGILRTLGPDTRRAMKALLRETVETVAARWGVKAELTLRESYPGVVNTDGETELVLRTARSLFGPDRVVELSDPTMTTEDFGYFVQASAGSFYHFGVGGERPLHNPCFLPDDALLADAAALHAAVAAAYLAQRPQNGGESTT